MNGVYKLIQGRFGQRAWFLYVDNKDYELLNEICELQAFNRGKLYLEGKKIVNPNDLISLNENSSLARYIKYLDEGHILLFNHNLGFQFLDKEHHIILKETKSSKFPDMDLNYLNGMITPDGKFLDCEYGFHWKLIETLENKDDIYVIISTDKVGDNSSVYLPNPITKEQISFLNENKHKLDIKQIEAIKHLF